MFVSECKVNMIFPFNKDYKYINDTKQIINLYLSFALVFVYSYFLIATIWKILFSNQNSNSLRALSSSSYTVYMSDCQLLNKFAWCIIMLHINASHI